MFWYGDHMGAWGYLLMTISMIVFWGLVIAGVVALVRYAGRGDQSTELEQRTPTPATPEQVLAERFARGDIDTDEYHQRLETLRSTGASNS